MSITLVLIIGTGVIYMYTGRSHGCSRDEKIVATE